MSMVQPTISVARNLPSTGDTLQLRQNEDGVIRFGFQNVNSIPTPRRGIASELDTVHRLGLDVIAFAETNRPWTSKNREIYDENIRQIFNAQTSAQYASMPARHGTVSQPGGVMQAITGHSVGRIMNSGSDKYGRFAWQTLRGGRDEGLLVITAYRVVQNSIETAGPRQAYTQQYLAMRKDGKQRIDPRKQILTDLLTLINDKRKEGYRPILMLDANGSTFTDTDFRHFQIEANLSDPYYEKFNEMPPTFHIGANRLDYILVDSALTPAISAIGYLGTHMAVPSDHIMAWVDFREAALFTGLIHRPPVMQRRQFRLHQKDKVDAFQRELEKNFREHNIMEKMAALTGRFHRCGATADMIAEYNDFDEMCQNIIFGAVKQSCRRDYGYQRSLELTTAGQWLNLQKMILNCKCRRVTPSEGVLHLAELLQFDLTQMETISIPAQREIVREARKELFEVQKRCEEHRFNWLGNNAAVKKDSASWKAKMKAMQTKVNDSVVNKKLSLLTKGRHKSLDRIEVCDTEWSHSPTMNELYHFVNGVFRTHALRSSTGDNKVFYGHHSLKVPHQDAVPVKVEVNTDFIILLQELPGPIVWRTITDQREIESELLRRNKEHLQQVEHENGPSTKPPISELIKSRGLGDVATAAMEGTYASSLAQEIQQNEVLVEWLEQFRQSDAEKALARTVGVITPEEVQAAFKVQKERTSSYGRLHYTIWKAMATNDAMANWMSQMISLPFLYGFAPLRWRHMVDVMIEKKPGNRQINHLRIIGLLEGDLNMALKFFAREFAAKMEKVGELSNEQWGSRKDRTSIDAAMIKLLTFEAARLKKSTIGMTYFDCTSCYDRMSPSLSNLDLRKRNYADSILKARAEVLQYLQRQVRTGLGDSEDHYAEREGDARLSGEVQGKPDNPALFTACSSNMLKTHAKLAPGLHIDSCNKERAIAHNNVMYVDDNDGNTSVPFNSERPLDEIFERIQLSSKIWNEVITFSGQALNYNKCKWQVLAWQVVRGEMQIMASIDKTLILEDHKGAHSVIQFLPPDQPNKGLGYYICPDGNQNEEYRVVMEKVRKMAATASSAFLTMREARQLLYQRLIPAIDYKLNLTYFTEEQCDKANTIIRKGFFPQMGFNMHTSDDVMRGPIEFGGMEMYDVYSRQTELQVENLVKQTRRTGKVGNDFLVALDVTQLISGLTTPLFEYGHKLLYMDQGFITSLHNRMAEIDATLWLEDAWTPQLQRVGDASIMDTLVQRGLNLTPNQLRQVNSVRIYLRVVTIADLADEGGTFIGDEALTGKWRADSDYEWPHQPCPPQCSWTLFRKCIRKAFCSRMSDHVLPTDALTLDVPLGKWKDVPRNTWYEYYRGSAALYKRYTKEDGTNGIQLLLRAHTASGFYVYREDVDEIPLDTHPIQIQNKMNESVWTQRRYDMYLRKETPPLPPGYIYEDTRIEGEMMTPNRTGSDGSVHRYHRVAAAAFLIPTKPDQSEYVSGCYLLENVSSINSYRAELEGAYRALCHMDYLGMDPSDEVTQWFDNSAGVKAVNTPPQTGKEMIQPEADLILAIHYMIKKLGVDVHAKHVKGHQDSKKRQVTQTNDDDSFTSIVTTESTREVTADTEHAPTNEKGYSDEALMNIRCDEIAGEVTAAAIARPEDMPPTEALLQPPYKGSKALLTINGVHITSGIRRHLNVARHGPQLRHYIQRRHGWSTEQFHSVHWEMIGFRRRKQTQRQRRFTCKLMHGVLPVGHVRQHVTKLSHCPGCECEDETIAHMFRCPNEIMKKNRADIIEALRKKGLRKISRTILDVVEAILQHFATGEEINLSISHPDIKLAVKKQAQLGWEYFLRGYLVKEWLPALSSTMNTKDEYVQFGTLLDLIWFDIAQPTWHARNEVAHGPTSCLQHIESERLAAQLKWYHDHREELLPFDLQHMAKPVEEITRMKPATRRAWVRNLEIATETYQRERYKMVDSQRTLDSYFTVQLPRVRPRTRPEQVTTTARMESARQVLNRERTQPSISRFFAPAKD